MTPLSCPLFFDVSDVIDDARSLLEDELEPRAAELEVQLRHGGYAELAARAATALKLYRQILREMREGEDRLRRQREFRGCDVEKD